MCLSWKMREPEIAMVIANERAGGDTNLPAFKVKLN